MKIPYAKDLQFVKIEGTLPEQKCNACGKPFTKEAFVTSIALDSESDYSIIVCSEQCISYFKKHHAADLYIAQSISECLRIRQ